MDLPFGYLANIGLFDIQVLVTCGQVGKECKVADNRGDLSTKACMGAKGWGGELRVFLVRVPYNDLVSNKVGPLRVSVEAVLVVR